jgi:hypothetical protein
MASVGFYVTATDEVVAGMGFAKDANARHGAVT